MAGRERVIARSVDLAERGTGIRFTTLREGRIVPAFAIRCDGVVRAFVNACAHQGVELDWDEGTFFDDERRYLVCATHGAQFEPADGRCVAGPCAGRALAAVPVIERNGEVAVVEDG
jgi:nitrite reductase/ring-hydroxylating ferredoxin subunit